MPSFKLHNILILATLLGSAALTAKADNLVLDGNFASDTPNAEVSNGALSQNSPWNVTSTSNVENPVNVKLLPSPLGPPDPLTVGSPDPGGDHVAYFVSDTGTQTLSQTLSGFIAGDTYEVSFDAYLGSTGENNLFTPSFSVSLGGSSIADFPLTDLPAPTSANDASAWTHLSQTFIATSSGPLDLDFSFVAASGTSISGGGKDILLDRVYVGIPVSQTPEPGSLILIGTGILSSLLMFGRRMRYAARP